jgi:hypothetical protein
MAEPNPFANQAATHGFNALQEPASPVIGQYLAGLEAFGIPLPDQLELGKTLAGILSMHETGEDYLEQNPKGALVLTGVAAQTMDCMPEDTDTQARLDVVSRAVLGKFDKTEGDIVGGEQIVDRYVNKELSNDVVAVFDGPLFQDIRQKLGASEGKVTDYAKIKVLDVDSTYPAKLSHMLELGAEDAELFRAHKETLEANAKKLNTEAELFKGADTVGPAWTERGNPGEKHTAFIPAILAEELIARMGAEQLDPELMNEYAFARHELVHCLDPLFVEGGFFGVNLSIEERRAEYYSGDKSGYWDVKAVVNLVRGVHDAGFDDIFPQDGGYNSLQTMQNLAALTGLETMLDLVTMIPESYNDNFLNQTSFSREYIEAGNGINDAVLRILGRYEDMYGEGAAQGILSAYVDKIQAALEEHGVDPSYVADNLAMRGPSLLAVLSIKNMQRRKGTQGSDFDWEATYGPENWAVEV